MKWFYKKLSFLVMLVFFGSLSQAQTEKKPTLMILPSDNWCTQRYFTTTYEFQGVNTRMPNYQQAFQEDTELPQVISRVGQLLTERGYSVKDAEQEIRSLSVKAAEDDLTYSSTSASAIVETPLDILKRKLKSDVIIMVNWQYGMDGYLSFTIEAFDSYTNKRIATSTSSSAIKKNTPLTIEKITKANIKNFDKQLSSWFDKQKEEGREIVLTIKCWENWSGNLEKEYNGRELLSIIQDWLQKSTVGGMFNLSDATESTAQFEQVHIPLSKDGHAIDAREFASQLRSYLQNAPYNITTKLLIRGLGDATLILGEK